MDDEAGQAQGLKGLNIWQKALDFAANICNNVLPTLPSDEKHAMVAQLRRSVQSIPANIAEGHGRYYYQESVRFCYIARGSLDESRSHLILANKLGYLSDESLHHLEEQLDDLRRMLNGYITYLKRSKRGSNEPGATVHEPDAIYEITEDKDQLNIS